MKTYQLTVMLSVIGISFVQYECTNKSDLEPVTGKKLSNYGFEINFKAAKTNSELKILTQDSRVNMIRNITQFDEVIKNKTTPLNNLNEKDLLVFREELVFNHNGIASMEYLIIKNALTRDDYDYVMSLFGLDTKDGFWNGASANPNARLASPTEDYTGYRCVIAKSCGTSASHICTSNC